MGRDVGRLPLLLFIGGLAFLITGILRGEGEAGVFFIFPFVRGEGLLSVTGILLIVASTFLTAFGGISMHESGNSAGPASRGAGLKKTRYGGLVFIGPIPVVVADSPVLAKILLAVGALVLLMVVFLLVFATGAGLQ
jgi:uncharacterized protein (TIGR00304 family)